MSVCKSKIMIKLIVEKSYNNTRLDAFLAASGCYKSRSLAAKFCDDAKVLVNGNKAQKKIKVFEADEVLYEPAFEDTELQGQNIPLDIRFEDEHVLVISKQPGFVCHPAPGHRKDTLVNALIYHCGKEHLFDNGEDDTRLGIVHRLDGDTSGLMICAKSNEAGKILSEDMKNHCTERHYKALVYGKIKQETGKIDVPLLRTLNKRPKMKASTNAKAKRAITSFEVLQRFESELGQFSLLDCQIHTGRTHQIRSHMEYINHPVVGDPLYNSGINAQNDVAPQIGLERQFLHSYKIAFKHPITGKELSFEDSVPEDLKKALDCL